MTHDSRLFIAAAGVLAAFTGRLEAQVQVDRYPSAETTASTVEVPSHLSFDGSVLAGLNDSGTASSFQGDLVIWTRGQPSQIVFPRDLNAFGLIQGAIAGLSDDGTTVLVDSAEMWPTLATNL